MKSDPVTKIFVNELPGSNRVLFHIIGSHNSDILSKSEAISRGVQAYELGSHITGPSPISNEIRTQGELVVQINRSSLK